MNPKAIVIGHPNSQGASLYPYTFALKECEKGHFITSLKNHPSDLKPSCVLQFVFDPCLGRVQENHICDDENTKDHQTWL